MTHGEIVLEKQFYHYSATGNTFIIFDNRDDSLSSLKASEIENICAHLSNSSTDGMILLEKSDEHDIKMNYFNNDGKNAQMCGNGARASAYCCVTELNLDSKVHLETMNSMYPCEVNESLVSMNMKEISGFNEIDISDLEIDGVKNSLYVDTGVPHAVFEIKNNVKEIDLDQVCPKIRFDKRFCEGANVGFFEKLNDQSIFYRSYERGVEAETLSCGTGVFSAALLFEKSYSLSELEVQTLGGHFKVSKVDGLYFFSSGVNLLNSGKYTIK